MPEQLILASTSSARAALLRAAGVEFAVFPAAIDEERLKHAVHQAGDSAIACALTLAAAKADAISRRFPDAIVIGADQILVAGTEWYDKPPDLAAAAAQLRLLRGRGHTLATAAVVTRDGAMLWQATSEPQLEMRWFSDGFIDEYIATEREEVVGSVGGYRLEGRGVQLFSRISGDHFAVLGLPLLELLDFLRRRGVIAA